MDDKDYTCPFAFTGKLEKLTVKIGPSQMMPAEKRAVEKKIGEGAKQSPNLNADYSTEPVLLRIGEVKVELPKSIENSIGMKLKLIPAGEKKAAK